MSLVPTLSSALIYSSEQDVPKCPVTQILAGTGTLIGVTGMQDPRPADGPRAGLTCAGMDAANSLADFIE